jgi:hypothetical protein
VAGNDFSEDIRAYSIGTRIIEATPKVLEKEESGRGKFGSDAFIWEKKWFGTN